MVNAPLSVKGIDACTPALMTTDYIPINKNLSVGIGDNGFPAIRDGRGVLMAMLRDRVGSRGSQE